MLKRQFQQLAFKDNQAGFTIIESLVAVIVLGILMTAIAPTIVLSTATRVQSRRIELATLAAGAYIDGVTSGSIPAPPISKTTSSAAPPGTSLSCDDVDDLKAKKGYCSSPKDDSSYKVFCIDGTGDGKCTKQQSKDMIVQAFGFNPDSTEASQGYKLSVRVYRADAFEDNSALTIGNGTKQSTFTGGMGKRKAPLAEITTEVVVAGKTTFGNWCNRFKNTKTIINNTNSDCGK
ncbi:hormogonium polysaccharide secretion pseudopilin HpsB [Rivularia sp. UHCC 0363]|uniref:hormogonium polysaccharide secretion pseudopilin HpsB n=1 Tax=Rivularia sp. UHCC 0363 TaxID=3110244 RepID=UPI002B1FFB31|nr:hormogonium polysaccharide secretion pseudopilin HpsB [Rivularia sp. UHCC 0363]MEA5598949.1 hormogonium polysaccharide secretion pseudopilin HpsB [Rivularia sp. UHCC 0363]